MVLASPAPWILRRIQLPLRYDSLVRLRIDALHLEHIGFLESMNCSLPLVRLRTDLQHGVVPYNLGLALAVASGWSRIALTWRLSILV